MVTELSRYNLGVASFKTLISRSYLRHQFSDNLWILVAGGSRALFVILS